MQTRITCPRCQTPYMAEVIQIVDVGQQPRLKEAFLNGYLNTAQCPSCQAVTRVTTPMLYHDPAHELFMVHIPMELSLPYQEQERLIGEMVRQTIDSLPPEQRRGYMLQPQTVLSLQTFVEKVLETEGVTPEMIAQQRRQADLLQKLITAGKEETNSLLQAQEGDIDGTFFAMLRATMDGAEQNGNEEQLLKLINLQAKLYRQTAFGRRLSQQQQAVQNLSREAKQSGLTPELLLKHVLAHRGDLELVDALISAGQPAFNYQFFTALTEKIEKRQQTGVEATDYLNLREYLVEKQQAIEKRSREILENAQQTLQELLAAQDRPAAVQANLDRIDEAFMYVLAANLEQANQRKLTEQAQALEEIQELIMAEMQQQAPPEIQLLNDLLESETDEERRQILAENQDLVTPELLEMIKALMAEVGQAGGNELTPRLRQIEAMIEARL